MERFLNINWTSESRKTVEDVFIDDERMQKESVMYRIITGNFTDPFKDIKEDYKEVNLEAINSMLEDLRDELDKDSEGRDSEKETKSEIEIKPRSYVPGITKPPYRFPKKSFLNKTQQAMCLRVLLRLSCSEKPELSQTEKEELQNYMGLKKLIDEEQEQFLQLAKSKWNGSTLNILCEDYINLRWNCRMQAINRLPRYYSEAANVPFVTEKQIGINFICNCLQIGTLPNIVLPTFTRPYVLRISTGDLQERFPPSTNHLNSTTFKLPLSEDPICERLAKENDVDLVISPSGLNCLMNNIGNSYSNFWMLPVSIKSQGNKNVLYLDKPAPPTASTVPQKNTWVYKYVLRRFLIHKKHFPARRLPRNASPCAAEEDVFDDADAEELLKLEDEYQNAITGVDNEDVISIQNSIDLKDDAKGDASEIPEKCIELDAAVDDKSNLEPTSDCSTSENKSESFSKRKKKMRKNKSLTQPEGNLESEMNVSYNLFVIGSQSEHNELMKNSTIKEYKILVRSKTDGQEKLPGGGTQPLILAPKLEHQIGLGAEAVTLEEALKQWVSLVFRPETSLARVRIAAHSSEILQIEKRTPLLIGNEVKRLYNLKIEDSLTILHNTIQTLETLTPGRYLIRHTIRNGAFATVYKEAESPGKNIFDLHVACTSDQFHTVLNPPWPMIDKLVTLPMHKCFERMPAMYYPADRPAVSRKKRKISKKAAVNIGSVRRSPRNKSKKARSNGNRG